MITLVDDGGGIDAGAVRRKAVERGLLARRRGARRPRGDPAHLHRGLLDRPHRHRRLGAGGGARRGGAEHGAAERPDRGGDDPRGGHEVHAPAAPHPRHHHRAHGRGGGADLRAPLGVGGGEPALPAERRHAHRRPRHPARARPHRAPPAPRASSSGSPAPGGRRGLRGDRRPRGEAARAHRGPAPRAAGRGDQGPRPGGLRGRGRHRRGHDPRRRAGGAHPRRGLALRGPARARQPRPRRAAEA